MNSQETTLGRPDLPQLDDVDFGPTRDALHEYSRVLGDWLKSSRPKRKHWWHASLRPALAGLTSGVIHADPDFEFTLNLRQSQFCVQTSTGEEFRTLLQGQPASEIARLVSDFLLGNGLAQHYFPDSASHSSANTHTGYSAEHAYNLAIVLNFVSAAMEEFRRKREDHALRPRDFSAGQNDMMEWIKSTFSLDYFTDSDEEGF